MTKPQPPSHNSEDSNPRKMGLTMTVLAWGTLIALLVFFFDDMLETQFNPNQQPNSRMIAGQQAEVILEANKQHHYVTNGTINNEPVVFMLDTGATDVVIPATTAKRLQLTSGRKSYANTANGTVTIYSTHISSLTIGDIKLTNVSAHINPSMDFDEILLGMSALKQIEFTQRGDTLILRQ
jgi:aspartyl protease family protein